MVINKLMTNTNQAMGIKVSSEIIQQVKLRMAELESPNDPYKTGWTQENLSEVSELGVKTVKRFLAGESVNSNSLIKIIKAVGLNPGDVIDVPLTKKDESAVNWVDICGQVLSKQKEARQLRKKATSIGVEVNVYVPLDLLEHKEQSRSGQNKANLEQNNSCSEPRVLRTYEHDEFLRSLINRQSKNKHIAIVGEAGAGKTTLLAKIADELDEQQNLQIFVSLADLQGRSLEEYIYGAWLPNGLGVHRDSLSSEQKNELTQQFEAGKIWLLLDGLDEMRAKSSADALDKINREINEVIGQSKVILTSRLNVWDAYLNRLQGFDTFRMGNFSVEQVDTFIDNWFAHAEKPESAAILRSKLNESKRDRIRDMVTHPLRLALLCQAFYRNPNTDLPETKAGLYELFVRYFYEWKPNIVDVDLRTQDTLREELHQALGKLALAGIESEAGFRLSRSLAVKEMGDRFFNLASDLGWLTLIERDERDEEVYSFFHATFQEYFAALAINDSDFFLSRKHIDKPLLEQKYRIFESQWRYCFLLWIGRERGISKNNKEELLKYLWEFKDNCVHIYSQKAKNLAVAATGEFSSCNETLLQLILKTTLNAAFGSEMSGLVCSSAKASLREADSIKVLEAFLSLIQKGDISEKIKDEVLRCFFQHWKQDKEAVNLLRRNELTEPTRRRFPPFETIPMTIEEMEDANVYQGYMDELYAEQYNEVYDLIHSSKNEESLIDFYESNPTHPQYDSILNEIILKYAESNRSINFIITTVLFPIGECMMNLGCRCPSAVSVLANIAEPLPEKLSLAIASQVSQHLLSDVVNRDTNKEYYSHYYNLLWKCSESINYHAFYEALHKPLPIHPEVADYIPAGASDILSKLESQFIDFDQIKIELDKIIDHPEICCLVVDVRELSEVSDRKVFAQKIANRIFDSLDMEIPVIQNITVLETVLLNLKRKIGIEKLAIALYGSVDNEAIAQLCHNLAVPSIEIRSFRDGQSTKQIATQIKTWLSEVQI
jgi:hypothetical protein